MFQVEHGVSGQLLLLGLALHGGCLPFLVLPALVLAGGSAGDYIVTVLRKKAEGKLTEMKTEPTVAYKKNFKALK